jgi:L-alanine-DL-glutamate epimerase-like enolase superfamily enzyme
MKVTSVKTTLLRFPRYERPPTFSVNPTHIFPELAPGGQGVRGGASVPDMIVVEVETDEGLRGLANTNCASLAVRTLIEAYLGPVLVGEEPTDTSRVWEKLSRLAIGLGRTGLVSIAVSLLDIALWDIKGKVAGQPVYRLLGGAVQPRLRLYASRLYGPDTGRLREEAASYVEQGFTAMKQRLAFGPAAGAEGMRKNYELVAAVRDTIGDDVELMVDCCRAFDAQYAVRMLRRLEEFDLVWVEEPVLPHDHEGYVHVRQRVSMPISGGEFEYDRHAFQRWAQMGCADIWQPDANRAGGITECQRIFHLAAAKGIPVIPHGGQLHNYHLIAASLNSPVAEYFPPQEQITDGNGFFWHVMRGEPVAAGGYLELPERPGLGLSLDPEAMARYTVDR